MYPEYMAGRKRLSAHAASASLCCILVLGVCATRTAGATGTFADEDVEQALSNAKSFILNQQRPDGSWRIHGDRDPCGNTALALIALHHVGVDVRNEAWVRGAKWMVEQDQPGTYGRALRVIALACGAHVNDAYVRVLRKDTQDLLRGMRANGGWRYYVDPRDSKRNYVESDNSNSQYVVLALREATMARVEVPARIWRLLGKYWLKKQTADGGWDYGNQTVDEKGRITAPRDAAYGSMSAAGLASSYIINDMLISMGRGTRPNCGKKEEFKPIKKALAWFDRNFRADVNPGKNAKYYYYYLYNIERIGATSGRKYFGKHDWYRTITAFLLTRRNRGSGKMGTSFCDHCWATVFLARGRAPIVMNKLEFPGLDWDVHSRDVANLVRDMTRRFEKPLNWQIVDIQRDVREIQDAHVLFLTGSRTIPYDDRTVAKLRRFILEGGTLFAQAACGSKAFDASFRSLCKRVLPECEMRQLAPEHPVFSTHQRIRGGRLSGIENGVRTCVFYTPADVSFSWHKRMSKTRRADFNLGANVIIYAMDKASFRTKRSVPRIPQVEPEQKLSAALIRHPAGYNANPIALNRLSEFLAQRTGIGLDVRKPVHLGKDTPKGLRLLWLSGHGKLDMSRPQKAALKEFLDNGGTLVADAAGGSAEFHTSVVACLNGLLAGATVREATAEDAVVNGKLHPKGYDMSAVRYRRALRAEERTGRHPRLLLYIVGKRVVAVVSRYDIASGIQGQTAWNCRGYSIESARKLGVNLALLAAPP